MRWDNTTLGAISVDIQTGPFGSQLHQSDYSENGIPVVMPKDLVGGKISTVSIAKVTEAHVERLSRHKIMEGDILYSRRGDVGRCAFVSKDETNWLCGTGCLRVTLNHEMANSRFIFYQLQTANSIGWVEKHAVGSTMLNLNTGILSALPIVLPPLAIQKRIADILSAYDNLIENNQKQIKLLEEAAQRLYKEWFIDLRFPGHENTPIHDGVPEGWKILTMDEIADYLNGYAFKPEDWGSKGFPIIKIKELNEGVTKDTPRNVGNGIPQKYIVSSGEILFSWSATLTAKIWDSETGLLNQHLFKVTPFEGISREFVLQSILITLDEFRNLTTGSTMKHIQRGKLREVFVKVPNPELMNKYAENAESIRNTILTLTHKIAKLTETRDRLLPKLMSGEIEV